MMHMYAPSEREKEGDSLHWRARAATISVNHMEINAKVGFSYHNVVSDVCYLNGYVKLMRNVQRSSRKRRKRQT